LKNSNLCVIIFFVHGLVLGFDRIQSWFSCRWWLP